MKQVIVLPPQDQGYFVTREPGDVMYNKDANYNPYAALVYAKKLKDAGENVVIVDAQAKGLDYELTKKFVHKLEPDVITYFINAFGIPFDAKVIDWKFKEKKFVLTPFQVDVSDTIKIYQEFPFEKLDFIEDPNIFAGKADFSLINLNDYNTIRINLNDFCPFQCSFCCRSGLLPNWKSVEETAEEINYILEKYKRKEFFLFCSEISLRKDLALELADRLKGKDLTLRTLDRVNLIEKAVYEELVKAGLKYVELGVESGSQKCLDYMGKGTKIADIYSAFEILNAFRNLNKKAFVIFGLPIEEWSDLIKTVKLTWDIAPNIVSAELLYPSPGSPLYEKLKAEGLLKTFRWEYYKHPLRRTIVFHQSRYKNFNDLKRVKSFFTALMCLGILPKNFSRPLARAFKNEVISFLETLNPKIDKENNNRKPYL
ncbi:MAG: radical SAM protein [Candidatus Bathyarchaeia archaeon]